MRYCRKNLVNIKLPPKSRVAWICYSFTLFTFIFYQYNILTAQSRVSSQIFWHSSGLDIGPYTPFVPSISQSKNLKKFHHLYAKYVFVYGSAYLDCQTKNVFLILKAFTPNWSLWQKIKSKSNNYESLQTIFLYRFSLLYKIKWKTPFSSTYHWFRDFILGFFNNAILNKG